MSTTQLYLYRNILLTLSMLQYNFFFWKCQLQFSLKNVSACRLRIIGRYVIASNILESKKEEKWYQKKNTIFDSRCYHSNMYPFSRRNAHLTNLWSGVYSQYVTLLEGIHYTRVTNARDFSPYFESKMHVWLPMSAVIEREQQPTHLTLRIVARVPQTVVLRL